MLNETTTRNSSTIQNGYDGLGRLVSVTDALDQVTRYSYDETGNKLTQTDALGRTTACDYDAINHPSSRTLHMGPRFQY